MSAPGNFRVLRSFVLHGVCRRPGEVAQLDDGELIGELVASGKIAPADAATAARLRIGGPIEWGAKRETGEYSPWKQLPHGVRFR